MKSERKDTSADAGGTSNKTKQDVENPFTRKNRDTNAYKPYQRTGADREETKNQPFLQRRNPEEARVSMSRQFRQIRLRAVPWFKTLLCFDFFARLVVFGGLTYFVRTQARGMNLERVTLEQEDRESPNRFSKTFGREQALDKLL